MDESKEIEGRSLRFETTVRELERTLLVRTNGNESLRNARTGNVYASRRGHENKRTVREEKSKLDNREDYVLTRIHLPMCCCCC